MGIEPAPVTLNLNEYRDKIYPRVFLMEEMHVLGVEAATESDFPIGTVWMKDLAVGYVIDRGDKFTFISRRHLDEDLLMTEEELKSLAIANFVRDFEFTFGRTIFGCYALQGDPEHCATAMFVARVWEKLVAQPGKDVVVAIPAYDLLFMTPADDAEGITNLKFELYKIQGIGIEKRIKDYLFLYKQDKKEWSFLENLGDDEE